MLHLVKTYFPDESEYGTMIQTPTNIGKLVLDGNTGRVDLSFGTGVTSATSMTGNNSTNAYDGSTFRRLPTVPIDSDLIDDSTRSV